MSFKMLSVCVCLLSIGPLAYSQSDLAPSVEGDWNGDGKREFAFSAQVKGGEVEDGQNSAEFAVKFADATVPELNVGCCEFQVMNEGDLNGDKTDELSVFQSPSNGCTYAFRTYTFRKGVWTELCTMMIPTACEGQYTETLKDRVQTRNGVVIVHEICIGE
jgi:hypothetical protein